jgi:L-asparaginase
LGEKDSEPDINHWIKLGKTIFKRMDEFDGFVVTHHVHSLLQSACALSYMLQNVTKPVVFTGSQIPFTLAGKKMSKKIMKKYKGLGIKANLINALQIAIQGPADVSVMFGNKLVRANQAHITKSLSMNLFDAPLKAVLATIDFGIKISEHARSNAKDSPVCNTDFDDNVSVVDFNSEQNEDYLKWVLEKKPSGIIILTHNPESALELLKKLIPASYDMPIVVYTDVPFSDKNNSEFIFIENMTFEATLMKLKWALGQTKDRKEIDLLMKKDIASELLEEEE